MWISSFQAKGPSSLLQTAWVWVWEAVLGSPTILRPFCSSHSVWIPLVDIIGIAGKAAPCILVPVTGIVGRVLVHLSP